MVVAPSVARRTPKIGSGAMTFRLVAILMITTRTGTGIRQLSIADQDSAFTGGMPTRLIALEKDKWQHQSPRPPFVTFSKAMFLPL